MEQYVPKSILVAEIKSLKKYQRLDDRHDQGVLDGLHAIEKFINHLEVKEIDLDKYYHEFLQKEWFGNLHVRTVSEMMAFTAKHFFELGLKAQKEE